MKWILVLWLLTNEGAVAEKLPMKNKSACLAAQGFYSQLLHHREGNAIIAHCVDPKDGKVIVYEVRND